MTLRMIFSGVDSSVRHGLEAAAGWLFSPDEAADVTASENDTATTSEQRRRQVGMTVWNSCSLGCAADSDS
ncbi:hypothetical protein [Pseudoxanthomonas sp.]|uniref:hypothetical protein n=1 Tax=Pseudoxanthomonas sp. TaxID=1871049 RepID=UPI0026190273|nr:hypothetical protein [Pseudoxanthomonas sp.]WDS35021.1 MAG: hypothetical protein O8I58_11625 [Pseudoxanthomonas sp.]